jgi:hypothetical protein
MAKHPDPTVRRAVRVLAMVGELHKQGFQRIRICPAIAPSGGYWRCTIGPAMLFHRDHGAVPKEVVVLDDVPQTVNMLARYTTGQENRYFDWGDAASDDARELADKFLQRFPTIAGYGSGWDYAYAGWYQRLLGLAEAGYLPRAVWDAYEPIPRDHIPFDDLRPEDWKRREASAPAHLPMPPPGELIEDWWT